jgi:phosphoglycerol transferase MdoB-like AlkP superfamily enzyme
MRNRLAFMAFYYLGWVLYFIIIRGVFLLYHYSSSVKLSAKTIFRIFLNGLRLDSSFAAYISLFPFLLITLSVLVKKQFWKTSVKIYTLTILIFLTVLMAIDLELYKTWGFRIDNTFLMYLNTPMEMLASSASSPWVQLTLIYVAVISAGIFILGKIIKNLKFKNANRFYFMIPLIFTVLLIIPIRGGFQLAAINISNVYFSKSSFANHAAINIGWNFFFSLLNKPEGKTNPYVYMDRTEADTVVARLLNNRSTDTTRLLNAVKPNVLVIIWESFTAKVSEKTGGMSGITPEFSRLCAEGILFTNMYATGDRSDKGIVGILSGYPAQPTRSIITIPQKAEKLPVISESFSKNGFKTAFYYGGEPEFANMKSFLVKSFDTLITKEDFPEDQYNSKWGAHDHIVFNQLLIDLRKESKPFFYTFFTLSSHEPFEVPIESKFGNDSHLNKYLSSLYYTDQSLGNFIRQAKTEKWWDSTLVVIIADHGHYLPGENAAHEKDKFHIPMLWVGGAVAKRNMTITNVCSQTDFAATLLDQYAFDRKHFKWSRPVILADHAYYAFTNGFGFVTQNGYSAFDHISKQPLTSEGKNREELLKAGKAYSQNSFQDYLEK